MMVSMLLMIVVLFQIGFVNLQNISGYWGGWGITFTYIPPNLVRDSVG
jgi:hypothetical protein